MVKSDFGLLVIAWVSRKWQIKGGLNNFTAWALVFCLSLNQKLAKFHTVNLANIRILQKYTLLEWWCLMQGVL